MSTLQSIRKHGAFLVIVIGLALFAFIAGDAAKVLQPHQNTQNVGKARTCDDASLLADADVKVGVYGALLLVPKE